MATHHITPEDQQLIQKYYQKPLEELGLEEFRAIRKDIRKKYHPDNFSKFDDETVIELAKERFQQLEALGQKIEAHLTIQGEIEQADAELPDVGYRAEGIKIDIMTTDPKLKFQLFRSRYIDRGDRVVIGSTKARLIALDNYSPRISAGFRDNIKVKLAFGPDDSIQEIVEWIFRHISGRTSSFVIENKVVQITPYEIQQAIKHEARLELGA